MRVAIAGAGKVGRSIARELAENGHEILLIDKDESALNPDKYDGVKVIVADACEAAALEMADLASCQALIAATGDDKVNLVVSLLAKTEYGVPRVVARVNHPKNEWMFDESWGVDVAVSTPRLLSALVEEAVSVGDLVKLMSLRKGQAELVEMTLPANAVVVTKRVDEIQLPVETSLTAIVRGSRVIQPTNDDRLEAGDELLFLVHPDSINALENLLSERTGEVS
jgi:trk system potassium uptake protein TrkA